MKVEPLTDLEMYDLIQAAYPGKFPDDVDDADGAWEAVMEFAENLSGFDEIADLLGRVVTLTMPMTALSGELVHCLGQVDILEGKANMMAAVKRRVPNAELSRAPDAQNETADGKASA